jgi:Ankyrin repeats (3 copies)
VPIEDPWGTDTSAYVSPVTSPAPLPRSLDEVPSARPLNVRFVLGEPDDPLVRAVVDDSSLSEAEKTTQLQSLFSRAASNGDTRCVRAILEGPGRRFVDVDAEDEDGITPLIHAACFGHADVVRARTHLPSGGLMVVLEAGVEVDKQDKRKWSALMWATTNSQPQIVRILLDHGASPAVRTEAGRTALDFIGSDDTNREIEGYLRNSHGNEIGSVGVGDDWYDKGFGEGLEEQFAESERKRRMMMESAFNLEVDISSLGVDEPPDVLAPLVMCLISGIVFRRGVSRLCLGEMSPGSNVRLHRIRSPRSTRYRHHKNAPTTVRCTETYPRKLHFPRCALRTLLPKRRDPENPIRRSGHSN